MKLTDGCKLVNFTAERIDSQLACQIEFERRVSQAGVTQQSGFKIAAELLNGVLSLNAFARTPKGLMSR